MSKQASRTERQTARKLQKVCSEGVARTEIEVERASQLRTHSKKESPLLLGMDSEENWVERNRDRKAVRPKARLRWG